jgi:integrase
MCEFIPASTESPAFLIESRGKSIPLAYNQFQNKLKQLISLIGLNPLLFSSHSFRRGGATLLANAGIPSNMILLIGDWKSDAYKKSKLLSL